MLGTLSETFGSSRSCSLVNSFSTPTCQALSSAHFRAVAHKPFATNTGSSRKCTRRAAAGRSAVLMVTAADKQTVLVTGAGGRTGKLVLQKLCARPDKFEARGLVRSEESAKALEAEFGTPAGTLYAGDFVADAPSKWTKAFEGAAALVIATSGVPAVTGPPGPDGRPSFGFKAGQMPQQVDWEGQKRQIDTAFEHGVQHVVLVSSMGICDAENRLNKIGDGNILIWKRRAEKYLMARGFQSYTIIHPGGLLDAQGGERQLVLGVDDELLAASPRSIPRADVAELCVQALLHPEARNRSVDAISKEPGTGEPTTDFAALYRDMSRNHSYEPAMPIADDPF